MYNNAYLSPLLSPHTLSHFYLKSVMVYMEAVNVPVVSGITLQVVISVSFVCIWACNIKVRQLKHTLNSFLQWFNAWLPLGVLIDMFAWISTLSVSI